MFQVGLIPNGSYKTLYHVYKKFELNPWCFEQFQEDPGFYETSYKGFILYNVSDVIDITAIVVDTPYQGHGLGQMLLDILIHHPRFYNYPLILEVSVLNLHAISFYKKNGFSTLYKRLDYGIYNGQRTDFWVMQLERELSCSE